MEIGTCKIIKETALSLSLIPTDCPIRKEDALPVCTKGDGNCFIYSLSRIVYGDENHFVEMKVRLIVEAVRHIDVYLDHNYLCHGYNYPHGSNIHLGSIYCTYWDEFQNGMDGRGENMVKFYKEETLSVVRNYKECGIWQIHHAASILG